MDKGMMRGMRMAAVVLALALSINGISAKVAAPIDLSGKGLEGTAFEICVNGKVLKSDSGRWTYAGSETASAPNGAWMTTYHLSGKGRFKGLHAYIDRQTFDGSGFIRERLRLSSDVEGKFRLTNVQGKNHLVFPIHDLPLVSGKCSVDETKLGSFVLKRDHGNHSFFPTRNRYQVSDGQSLDIKGPITHLYSGDGHNILWAYEHASQDGKVIQKIRKKPASDAGADAAQGVSGNLMEITDNDMWFIATSISVKGYGMTISNKIRHGGYLDGEFIPVSGCYETVWSAVTEIPAGQLFEDAVNDYLYSKISNNRESRRHQFYYNTWGMQRDYPGSQLYTVYTPDNLLKEIDLAKEMGIDRFVLDDGWEQAMGQWTPNEERLPDGLEPLVDAIKEKGMIPGIWISPLATKDTSTIFREHPGWIIKDMVGDPVLGQWNCPLVDLGSPYYDILLSNLKDLVDLGFKYFKWDGINTFNSYLDGFRGIGGQGSIKEKVDRYNYQFPFYITGLMRALREYDPEVVVEIDLTENERCMIGLMPLQEGKFYYINNGSSGYRDYSEKNADSKRQALTDISGVIPPELVTLSVYPNNTKGAMKHNVNTILAAGHGFWGRLDASTEEERAWINSQLTVAKRVLTQVEGHPLFIPEPDAKEYQSIILENPDNGYGIVTVFGKKEAVAHGTASGSKSAGVIGCRFTKEYGGRFQLEYDMEEGEDSFTAFVIGAEGNSKVILSSSGILSDIWYDRGQLVVTAQTDSEIKVSGKEGTISIKAGDTVRL